MILKTDWAEIKRQALAKNLPIHWSDAQGLTYALVIDGAFNLHCVLKPGTDELADFETNYKNLPVKRVTSATSSLSNPETFRFRGKSTGWTTVSSSSANIDLTAAEELFVDGGFLFTQDAALGDTVTFQVVHPSAGVVETYVSEWVVLPGSHIQQIEVYPARIPAGLILRVVYTKNGSHTPSAAINYRLHKKT